MISLLLGSLIHMSTYTSSVRTNSLYTLVIPAMLLVIMKYLLYTIRCIFCTGEPIPTTSRHSPGCDRYYGRCHPTERTRDMERADNFHLFALWNLQGHIANVKKVPYCIITLGSIFHVFSPFPRKSEYSKM
jgi:hypothetical protein